MTRRTAWLSVCLAGLFLSGLSTVAIADDVSTSVSVIGPGSCGDSGTTSAGCTFSNNSQIYAAEGTGQATASLSNGTMGVSTTYSMGNSFSGGSSEAAANLSYDFNVSGASSGTLVFSLVASGNSSLSIAGCSGGCNSQSGTSVDIEPYETFVGGPSGTVLSLGNGVTDFQIATQFGPNAPSPTLVLGMEATTTCSSVGGATSCVGSSDFIDTLSITGAEVFDSSGNLVTNASVISDSGFNPNAQITPTPEPSSLLLLGLGLSAFMGVTRKKFAATHPSRSRLLRVAIILALGCVAAVGSARADQASAAVTDNSQFNCYQQSTVSSGATSQSCNIAGTGVSGPLQATASLGTGIEGASASFNASQPGINDLPVGASATLVYVFSVGGVSSGTADIDLVAQGSGSCVAVGGSPECGTAGILVATGVQNGANVVLANGTSSFVAEVPFTSSSFGFNVGIEASAACATLYGVTSCGANSNYLDTVSITGAQIYDSSGNLSGASIVSETGFNPNAPVATPEPSCLILLGAGLIGLIGLSFRKAAI